MTTCSRHLTLATAAVLTLSTLTACGSSSEGGAADGASVVATTTPLGSVTDQIAQCADGASTTLMGPGDDPHEFSPSSQQVVDMARADLVIANGLGLEGGLEGALDSAESDGAEVLEVATEVDPLPFGEHDDEEDHDHEAEDHEAEDHEAEEDAHDHGSEDPHFWLDTARMANAAVVIGDHVTEVTDDEAWSTCGAEVSEELTETDEEIREILAAVPDDRRVLVTDHDSFGYFADAYDFEVAGVVIPGGSTDAEPSSSEVAKLVELVRDEDIPALFSNTAASSKLVEAVAAETGQQIQVVPLYVGSVGEADGPAADYQGMVLENARAIAEALA